MADEPMCHCGRPLHYSKPEIRAAVQRLIDELGEYVPIVVPAGTWLVQRHYIALHGIKARELPGLGFERVDEAAS